MTVCNVAPRSVNLQGLCLVDGTNAWAVGDGGMILVTRDAGARWTAQGHTDKDLRAVHFADTERGWIAWPGRHDSADQGWGGTLVGKTRRHHAEPLRNLVLPVRSERMGCRRQRDDSLVV